MKKIKQKLREFRLAIGKFFLDKKRPLVDVKFPAKKILFLRHDGKIGDYIVSSFVFREIKKQSPNTQIGVVCSVKNKYLFEQNPYIDNLYFVRTKNILDYFKCGKQLAQEQYDAVIDPTLTLRNRDLLFLCTINAKCYVGYEKSNYNLFQFNVLNEKQHFSTIYRQTLEIIGFEKINTTYEIPYLDKSENAVLIYLNQQNIQHYICVNLFGAGSARRFSNEKAQKLLTYLTQHSSKPIILLTYPEVTEQLKQMSHIMHNVFVYEYTQTIFDNIALIRNADLLISPDTSTVHIASGLNKKMIAFYSEDQQNFIHWHPNNENAHIIYFKERINDISFNEIKPDWLK